MGAQVQILYSPLELPLTCFYFQEDFAPNADMSAFGVIFMVFTSSNYLIFPKVMVHIWCTMGKFRRGKCAPLVYEEGQAPI